MKTSLTEILVQALVGKRVKLYKVLDKRYEPDFREYCLLDERSLPHPKKCEIIGDAEGVIKNIASEYDVYNKSDYVTIHIVDDNDKPIFVHDANTVTSNVELLN